MGAGDSAAVRVDAPGGTVELAADFSPANCRRCSDEASAVAVRGYGDERMLEWLLGADALRELRSKGVDDDGIAFLYAQMAAEVKARRAAIIAEVAAAPRPKRRGRGSRPLSDAKPKGRKVDVGGVAVDDSAAMFARLMDITEDERLAECERFDCMAMAVLPRYTGTDRRRDAARALWEAFGIDALGEHREESAGRPCIDWHQDAGRVRSSLRMAYGIDWDAEAADMPFRDLCDLLSGLTEGTGETPFQQAVYYRTARPPRRTKYNNEAVDAFEAAREHYALDKAAADPYGDELLRRIANG